MPDVVQDRFHPRQIAKYRAHERRTPGSCARPCDCEASPDELAAAWAGAGRMAVPRAMAGQPLNAIDTEALARMVAAGDRRAATAIWATALRGLVGGSDSGGLSL